MKKNFILFLLAFLPFAFMNAQEVNPVGDASATEGTKCKVSCLLTSCEIECTPQQGAANCGCWFGLAQCTCIDIATEGEVSQTAEQRVALESAQSELNASGHGDVAAILGQIQNNIDQGKDIGDLIREYGTLLESKPGGERGQIESILR